jgi:serine/threonine-protein kinase RsbW
MEQTLQLRNDPADLAPAEAALTAFAAVHRLPPEALGEARLALEEAFTNIIKYAHPDGRHDHPVTLRLSAGPEWLELELIDTGLAFDPLASTADQLDRPFANRDDGLMGIPLIRALVDECSYARRDGCNHLRLRKRIRPAV